MLRSLTIFHPRARSRRDPAWHRRLKRVHLFAARVVREALRRLPTPPARRCVTDTDEADSKNTCADVCAEFTGVTGALRAFARVTRGTRNTRAASVVPDGVRHSLATSRSVPAGRADPQTSRSPTRLSPAARRVREPRRGSGRLAARRRDDDGGATTPSAGSSGPSTVLRRVIDAASSRDGSMSSPVDGVAELPCRRLLLEFRQMQRRVPASPPSKASICRASSRWAPPASSPRRRQLDQHERLRTTLNRTRSSSGMASSLARGVEILDHFLRGGSTGKGGTVGALRMAARERRRARAAASVRRATEGDGGNWIARTALALSSALTSCMRWCAATERAAALVLPRRTSSAEPWRSFGQAPDRVSGSSRSVAPVGERARSRGPRFRGSICGVVLGNRTSRGNVTHAHSVPGAGPCARAIGWRGGAATVAVSDAHGAFPRVRFAGGDILLGFFMRGFRLWVLTPARALSDGHANASKFESCPLDADRRRFLQWLPSG